MEPVRSFEVQPQRCNIVQQDCIRQSGEEKEKRRRRELGRGEEERAIYKLKTDGEK